MIRVTVELIPGGLGEAQLLGTCEIHNDLEDSYETKGALGSYQVRLSKRGRPNLLWKRGRVRGFDRRRRGAWDLLYLALHDTVGARNPTLEEATVGRP